MIINLETGGTSLNFAVKAYASEAELLAAVPKDNTIGIITTTPITSWIFSVAEPEVSADGMVWISTGTESAIEFNALKKNAVQVYPNSAKQYVGGEWIDVNAKSYQNNRWVSWWNGELYTPGNEWERVTGGWVTSIATNGKVTKNDDSVTVEVTVNAQGGTFISTANPIDLTGYSYISVNVIGCNGTAGSPIRLVISEVPITGYGSTFADMITTGPITLDVSGHPGLHYIGIGGGWVNPCYATFNEVKLCR